MKRNLLIQIGAIGTVAVCLRLLKYTNLKPIFPVRFLKILIIVRRQLHPLYRMIDILKNRLVMIPWSATSGSLRTECDLYIAIIVKICPE